jgi:hypothetical protein
MSGKRLFGIAVILALATFAWFVLGGSIVARTGQFTSSLGNQVSGLWGSPQSQEAPSFSAREDTRSVDILLNGSDIDAKFKLDQRRKGLLWYATYVVDFQAAYRVENPSDRPVRATMRFKFPDSSGAYDGFKVVVNGQEMPVRYSDGVAISSFDMPARREVTVRTGYRTNGMERWSYQPSPGGAGVVRGLTLNMHTDFHDVDYPPEGVSPTTRAAEADGWKLTWKYESVVSGRSIGLVMPAPQNPGPLVSRITFFAPISLLFFFASLVLITATKNVKLHPVHYGFLAAAFFAFDLLLAYLADQVDINLAFVIASLTSVGLVVGYLRSVIGKNRALLEIAIGQVIFLVLFSYSFFFEGYTGLAVTIGSVLTLAFFMVKTAHVDWEDVFPPKVARPVELPAAAPQQTGGETGR